MTRTRVLIPLAVLAIAGGLWGARSGAPRPPEESGNAAARQRSAPAGPGAVPPYYKSEQEAKPFPRLLSPDVFRGYPAVVRAYQIANAIPGVIAQQPCYCWCEANFRHKSLLDCYASDHGAG